MVGSTVLNSSDYLYNLGVWMEGELSMTVDANKLVEAGFYSLRQFKAICRVVLLIPVTPFAGLATCNIKWLKTVMNAAARCVSIRPKHNHISPVLCSELQ